MSFSVLDSWHADPNRAVRASQLRTFYETLSTQLFQQYEPTKFPSSRISREFLIKVENWLQGFPNDEERWSAYRSIEYLFFAGHAEFEELYRCAVNHNLIPWLLDQANIDVFSINANCSVAEELAKCWICPVTDSLRINGFLHVTGLPGQSLRPDWMSLKQFADPEKIQKYVEEKNIEYLVLVEDFVGSGGQLSKVLKFAEKAFSGPILLMPLIICAPGERKLCTDIESFNRSNIFYKPTLVIEDSCLIGPRESANEPKLFNDLMTCSPPAVPM